MQKNIEKLDYRWENTLRVANNGKQIAEAEGANVELDIAACLLHDVSNSIQEKTRIMEDYLQN